jgi:hypothetical protein
MSFWIFPAVCLLIGGGVLLHWGLHLKLRQERENTQRWREIALRAHTTSTELLARTTELADSLKQMTVADSVIVTGILLDRFEPKVQEQGKDIAYLRVQDMLRGYGSVEIADGGIGDGYHAG